MRFGIWEILLIALLIIILFGGAKKIPEIARNIASGINTFKKEVKEKPELKKSGKKKSK